MTFDATKNTDQKTNKAGIFAFFASLKYQPKHNIKPAAHEIIMKYSFRELVDLKKLQELTDELYTATAIPASFATTKGEILTGSGWQKICTDFHKKIH